jgi:predicted metal-dependent peptidase
MKIFTRDEKIQNARLALVMEFPFFGSVFFRLNVFEDRSCRTAWVDGVSLGYNPDYLATLSHECIIGLFVHEVLHVVLKHHLREELGPLFKDKHDKFNRAADYALNPMIETTAGMEVGAGWLLDMDKWSDSLTEDIFNQLPDDPSNDKCKGGGAPGTGMPGSMMPGQVGEVRAYKGGKASPAEKAQQADKVDQWVQAAGMKAQGVGRLSTDNQRLIKKVVAPTVYWADELQNLCEEITRDDYTWARPNMRYMDMGVYLPSLHDTAMPDLLFFVDVSGSLNDDQLAQIMAEIRTIISTFNVRVIVVYWNTQYVHHEEFMPEDVLSPDFSLDARGGGGTGFSRCWDWADDQEEIDPKGIVFFTDCETDEWPEEEPDCPVIWAQVADGSGSYVTHYIDDMPDYGSHVRIPTFKGVTI